MTTLAQIDSDRAELTFSQEIPDGEYNREFTVEARREGLLVEDTVLVPWNWILRAASVVLEIHELVQNIAQAAPCRNEAKEIQWPNKSQIEDQSPNIPEAATSPDQAKSK